MNSNSHNRVRYIPWICGIVAIALVAWFVTAWPKSPAEKTVDRTAEHSPDPKHSHSNEPPLPRSDFVGSAACAECHLKIAESYRDQPMAQSLGTAESMSEIEDFQDKNSFSPDGRHWYSVEKTSEGVFHHERLTDANGETLYDQSVPVAYTMGSGHQGRSYLIDRGGLLFMSPITWYSRAAHWDLSPQYKLPVHRRFSRRINDGCLNCQVGQINDVRGSSDRYQSPPFQELAIGCERCHGPGAEHIRFRRTAIDLASPDPIVNPAKLDPARREDICASCHLQGEGVIARSGHEIGDFRPGERLEETCVIFVSGTRMASDGTTRAVSQVEQMRASRCFQKSEGKFGCTSCHAPHSSPQTSERGSFYRQKCLACHADQSCSLPEDQRKSTQADDSCVACHMPRLVASDVPHTSQTDHRLMRRPSIETPDNSPFGIPQFYDHAETRLPQSEIDYTMGLWLAENAEKRTDRALASRAVTLLTKVMKDFPDDPRTLNALGTASAVNGRFDDSIRYWEKSLALDPKGEQTLEMLTVTLHKTGHPKEALGYLKRTLELNPWKATLWGRYAGLLSRDENWAQAIEAAHKALELDPSVLQTYQFLADAYRKRGDSDKSRHYADLHEKIRNSRE